MVDSCRQLTPLGQRVGAVLLEDGAAVEMAVEIGMIVDGGVNRREFLQGGNAVPPFLAIQIAKLVSKTLK
jgi:hypothetical protein